jgi:hypothetical protein
LPDLLSTILTVYVPPSTPQINCPPHQLTLPPWVHPSCCIPSAYPSFRPQGTNPTPNDWGCWSIVTGPTHRPQHPTPLQREATTLHPSSLLFLFFFPHQLSRAEQNWQYFIFSKILGASIVFPSTATLFIPSPVSVTTSLKRESRSLGLTGTDVTNTGWCYGTSKHLQTT